MKKAGLVNLRRPAKSKVRTASNGHAFFIYVMDPEKAREILNRFLSIQRFYRYIAIRATPDEAQKFFTEMDVRMGHLALTWHGFDLEKIDAETAEVLTTLKAKRDEIRQRRKKSK